LPDEPPPLPPSRLPGASIVTVAEDDGIGVDNGLVGRALAGKK